MEVERQEHHNSGQDSGYGNSAVRSPLAQSTPKNISLAKRRRIEEPDLTDMFNDDGSPDMFKEKDAF